ncbi:MAG: glycosyltransferase family 4 protein [Cycloclasticus sp.]
MINLALIHNSYKERGGEDSVLDSEVKLLSDNGHKVTLILKKNDSINSFSSKVNAFLDVAYSKQSRQWMTDQIIQHKPDVVHVHNFFPLLSPSIYDACLEANVPVVQTLHNYRTMCPGALLMRDGKICEKCVTGSAYQSVLHGCYKDSVIGTFAVARMVEKHRALGTWKHKVNRFIALTEFARNKFIEAGFPANKIVVKPNFTEDSPLADNDVNKMRTGALFVGRLSEEKGMATLLNAWKQLDVPLRIAGSGPLENTLSDLADNGVEALGMLDKKSVQKEMRQAAFLVMPSEWYEGFPMVLVEAFSLGLPVVASRLGGMAEIVEDGVTGLHFEAGNANDLADKVRWMDEHPEECLQMGLNARKVYEQKYTPDKNYDMLIGIYQQAIDSQKS